MSVSFCSIFARASATPDCLRLHLPTLAMAEVPADVAATSRCRFCGLAYPAESGRWFAVFFVWFLRHSDGSLDCVLVPCQFNFEVHLL